MWRDERAKRAKPASARDGVFWLRWREFLAARDA
jgi:hypothetical protein